VINPQTSNGVFSTFPGNGGDNLPPYSKSDLYAIGDRYRPAVKNLLRRIDWRIKSILYFHNEIPKWPTKWQPNWKLATIFKSDKVKGDITHLWAIFIHMHQYIYNPYYLLRLAMTGSRNSRWRSSKSEVPIFHLVEELATQFQIIIPRFRGRPIQWRHSQHYHTTTEGSDVGISLLRCVQVEI